MVPELLVSTLAPQGSSPGWWLDPGWWFGIIGTIGSLVTVFAFVAQRRSAHAYDEIFRQAEQNWRGRFTAEQVVLLSSELRQLKDQIARDVPHEAQRVFLLDQQNAIAASIAQLHNQYVSITRRLTDTVPPVPLDASLAAEIERDIMPEYRKRERRRRLLSGLVAFLLATTVLPFVVPYYGILDFLRPFGLSAREIYGYLGVVAVTLMLLMLVPIRRWAPRRKRTIFVVSGGLLCAWVAVTWVDVVTDSVATTVVTTVGGVLLVTSAGRLLISLYV